MPKFPVNKGFKGFVTDDEAFLRPDGAAGTDPWKADGHSTVGYDAKFDDSSGYERGEVGFKGSDDASFLKPSWTGDVNSVNANQGYLIDNDPSLPSNKLVAGGGPLSQKGGVGAGKARYAPKNTGHSGQKNRDSLGGVSKQGRR